MFFILQCENPSGQTACRFFSLFASTNISVHLKPAQNICVFIRHFCPAAFDKDMVPVLFSVPKLTVPAISFLYFREVDWKLSLQQLVRVTTERFCRSPPVQP